MLTLIKAHAYGNDFLYLTEDQAGDRSRPALARRLCDRHRGIGADGLIVYSMQADGARMHLTNADGSFAEISGNGLRALAAIVVRTWTDQERPLPEGGEVLIETDAGPRRLTLVGRDGARMIFRAAMGTPRDLREETIEAGGERVRASVFSIGNPQCVLLGPLPDDERFARLGTALAAHPMFPDSTNVEFVQIDAPDRVRIRIWERGVGPTESSGTGACASAIAAIAHGGAARSLAVVAPGGEQQVDWTADEVMLTGWAEIVWEGRWLAGL